MRWLQVLEDAYLPQGLCSICTGAAVDAANFSTLCRKAEDQWETMLQLLGNLPPPEKVSDKCTKLYAFLEDDQMTIQTTIDKKTIKTEEDVENLTVKEKSRSGTPQSLSDLKKFRKKFKKLHCQCPMCQKEFRCAEHLSQHFKYSSDFKRACHVCAKIMPRNDLVQHLSLVHKTELFDCKKCPALFLSKIKYLKHTGADHAKGACTCGDCGRSFQTIQAYHAHQNMHIPKTCPGCNKVYRNQPCYIHHVKTCCNLDKNRKDTHKTKHKVTVEVKNKLSKRNVRVGLRGSAQNECICDYCNKKFAGKKFVAAHIQIVHLKNTHQPCPYCGKEFASAHMTTHIKSHQISQKYKCQYCNLVLKTRLGFSQHLRLHTGEKPYPCKHCGETFSASSRRSEHIRKVHNVDNLYKHACDMCPARFSFPFRLKKHIADVHSEEGEDSVAFECPECHEKFRTCRGLIHHSRKHQQGIIQQPKKKIPPVKVFTNRKAFDVADMN